MKRAAIDWASAETCQVCIDGNQVREGARREWGNAKEKFEKALLGINPGDSHLKDDCHLAITNSQVEVGIGD